MLLPVLSVLFAVASIEGGILLALGSSIPISPYVTTISFTIYAVCRVAGGRRTRRWGARRAVLPAAPGAHRDRAAGLEYPCADRGGILTDAPAATDLTVDGPLSRSRAGGARRTEPAGTEGRDASGRGQGG